jgi:pyruvate formate lyase activating enzyme
MRTNSESENVKIEENNNSNSDKSEIKGVIFNIQRYSIHDGPGIRTTIFLKGCPLSCIWCQNPESQSHKLEIFYNAERCVGCGKCITVCPVKAIKMLDSGKVATDRNICTGCGTCVEACPENAREHIGKYMTVREVFEEARKDEIFYKRSGGGVTLSGGDPFAQADFSAGILKLCKEAGIHTAVEICGYTQWKVMEPILPYVDLVLYDLKHMDPDEHKKLTGVPNKLILENIKKIHKLNIMIFMRIPVIPGYNDSLQNIEATVDFVVNELDPSIQVNILPYHRLGESKVVQLEKPAAKLSAEPPDENYMLHLKEIMEARGLKKVIIGG